MGDDLHRLLQGGVAGRVFPAAVAEVGSSGGVVWREPFGRLTFDPDAAVVDEATPFDLASLTKPIVTTSVAMQLVADQRLRLDDRVGAHLPEWSGLDRERVTVRDLLEHAGGLSARLVDAPPVGRRAFEHEICTMGLEYAPRTRSIYSDLGFILLGFIAADRGGCPLDAQFENIRSRLASVEPHVAVEWLSLSVRSADRRHVAPTLPMADDVRRGRVLAGEVHDNYAAALGGGGGHAGLFGTVGAVAAFARAVLRAARGDGRVPPPLSSDLVTLATARTKVPGSSRALGWDTMLPTSSCGSRMSPSAFGHVGFTGTSLWIDPARDRYFVLLTNRACGGGTLDQMRDVRRAFHDAASEL